MAYTDVWASPITEHVMVNDVDLTVTLNNKVFYPNEWILNNWFMNRLNEADRYNNVEKIVIHKEQLKELGESDLVAIVTVTSHRLSTNYQPVSIVITGQFDFNKVKVKDKTFWDYRDATKESASTMTVVVIILVLVVVVFTVSFIT